MFKRFKIASYNYHIRIAQCEQKDALAAESEGDHITADIHWAAMEYHRTRAEKFQKDIF